MRLITGALVFLGLVTTAAASVNATPTVSIAESAASTQACHPLTDGGKCYEPGEFCRTADHNLTGRAGDGKEIACWDNHGWRWEPVTGLKLACTIHAGGPTKWEFQVTATVPEREYLGSFPVSFTDKPGHVFLGARVYPNRYASPAKPYRVWVDVPAGDTRMGIHPSRCVASV